MNVHDVARVLRTRWLSIVATVAVFLVLALGFAVTTKKLYEASAQIYVSVVLPNDSAALAATNTFAVARVQSYVSLVSSPDVTDSVVSTLHLKMSAAAVAREVTADAPLNKVLINVHVKDASADRAAEIANAVANRFTVVISSLDPTQNGTVSPVRLSVTKSASAPHQPIQPRTKLYLEVALLLGLVAGFGLARLRDLLDDRYRSSEDLQKLTGCPVLTALPPKQRLGSNEGVVSRAIDLLAASLPLLNVDRAPRVIAVVTSSVREGTSTVAIQLARALAKAGSSVCLVEANLGEQTFAETFGPAVGPDGLTPALRDGRPIADAAYDVGDGLFVLPSGQIPPNPREILSSERFREGIQLLCRDFRYVVLDGGAVLAPGSGGYLAHLSDKTILTVRERRSFRREIVAAAADMSATASPADGVVVIDASKRTIKSVLARFGSRPTTLHERVGSRSRA